MNRILLIFLCIIFSFHIHAQDWKIKSHRSISKSNPISYSDNIEMTGKKVAGIIHYDVDSLGMLTVERELIYPQLRKYIGENDNKWAVY